MRILFFLLAAAVLLFAASFAHAQQPRCGPAVQVETFLREKYGESPAFIGSKAAGYIVVTVNPETRTWTAYSRQGDVACLLSDGEKAELVDLPKPGNRS